MNVKVGDLIYIPCVWAYSGHGATVEVQKVNRRTLVCLEREGSYRPGMGWNLRAGREYFLTTYSTTAPYVTTERFILGDHGEML